MLIDAAFFGLLLLCMTAALWTCLTCLSHLIKDKAYELQFATHSDIGQGPCIEGPHANAACFGMRGHGHACCMTPSCRCRQLCDCAKKVITLTQQGYTPGDIMSQAGLLRLLLACDKLQATH